MASNHRNLIHFRLTPYAATVDGKLVTNVFVMPLLCGGLCILHYLNQRRTIAAVISMGGADDSAYNSAKINLQHNIFFAIFLVLILSNIRVNLAPNVSLKIASQFSPILRGVGISNGHSYVISVSYCTTLQTTQTPCNTDHRH